jgi:hypothetical protein
MVMILILLSFLRRGRAAWIVYKKYSTIPENCQSRGGKSDRTAKDPCKRRAFAVE